MGGTAAAMIEKAVARGHVKVSTYGHNTHVYHLCRRPFYAALGQADNRNRRQREPQTIRNRLMGFDFVLTNPEHDYLATEEEKLAYFHGTLGTPLVELPGKIYRSAQNGQVTTRYFVDKFPIFLSGSPAVGTFCFVDEGAASLSGFETYLNQHGRLFIALRRFDLIYVAPSTTFFKAASALFERFLTKLRSGSNNAAVDPAIRRMLDHFAARQLFEAKQFSSFDRAKLIRFRQEQQEFSDAKNAALYDQWKNGGEPVFLRTLGIEATEPSPIYGNFSSHWLEHDYGFFGVLSK